MSYVKLKNRHLLVAGALAEQVFGASAQAHVVYYAQHRSLLLAPMEDDLFPTLHKTGLQMLKTRNLQGDKSLSLEEILIDNEIDDADRDLVFQHHPGMLHVTL